MKSLRFTHLLSAGLLTFSLADRAQERKAGFLSGRVEDEQGVPISCATVEWTGEGDGARSAETDARGEFDSGPLHPGRYRLRFSCDGYETVEFTSVEVSDGVRARMKVRLGSGSEVVNVQAEPMNDRISSTATTQLNMDGYRIIEFAPPRNFSDCKAAVDLTSSETITKVCF